MIALFHQRLVPVVHVHPVAGFGDDALGRFLSFSCPEILHGVCDDRDAVHPGIGAHVLEVVGIVGEHRAILGLCNRLVQAVDDLSQPLDVALVLGGLEGNPTPVAIAGVDHHVATLKVLHGEHFA